MVEQQLDGIPFRLKEPFDFGFVSRWGRIFQVFDDQDSGNICFGTEQNGERFSSNLPALLQPGIREIRQMPWSGCGMQPVCTGT